MKCSFLALGLGLVAPFSAQSVLVVDTAGHPDATHATIQAALDDARDGDLVLVRFGRYLENLVIAGKSITLQAEQDVLVDGGLEIRDVPEGGAVSVRDLENTEEDRGFLLSLHDCQGSVHLDRLQLHEARGVIRHCASVVFSALSASGRASGLGLVRIHDSTVRLFQSSVFGWSVADDSIAVVSMDRGFLGLHETQISGHWIAGPYGPHGPIPSLWLANDPEVDLKDSPVSMVGSGSITELTSGPHGLESGAPAAEGAVQRLVLHGAVDEEAWVLVSDQLGAARGRREAPLFLLQPMATRYLGTLAPSTGSDLVRGELTVDLPVPPLPPGALCRTFSLQALFVAHDPPAVTLSGPTSATLIASSLVSYDFLASGAAWEWIPSSPEESFTTASAAGDVDGDGFDDVFVGPDLVRGSSAGLLASPSWRATDALLAGLTLEDAPRAAGDLNGDGYGDAFARAHEHASGIELFPVWLGSPSGLARTPTWILEGFFLNAPAAADVNGDGYGDLVFSRHTYDQLWIWYGSPLGLPVVPLVLPITRNFGPILAAGDVNGDGFDDVVAYDTSFRPRYQVLLIPGSEDGLARRDGLCVSVLGCAQSLNGVGDVDGDGIDDLLGETSVTCFLLRGGLDGPGDHVYARIRRDAFPGSLLGSGAAGDVNGDGFADTLAFGRDFALVFHGQP